MTEFANEWQRYAEKAAPAGSVLDDAAQVAYA